MEASMATPLSTFLIVALLALAIGGVWLLRFRHRRAVLAHVPLLIGEAMAKRGVYPADAESAGMESEVAAAVQRCEACAATEQCRDWIAGGRRRGNQAFCPNAVLFDEIEAGKTAALREQAEKPSVVLPFT